MFTIDLLKGRNLPEKSGWREIAMAYAAMSVLAVCAIAVSGSYLSNKRNIKQQQLVIDGYNLRIDEMAGDKAMADSIAAESQDIRACLIDVSSALKNQVQWSDMLLAINESLSENLNIDQLDVRVKTVPMIVPQKDNPDTKVTITVPARTLVISLFTSEGSEGDLAVRKFQKKLLTREPFKKYIREIVIALREPDLIKGGKVIRYELNCIFNIEEL